MAPAPLWETRWNSKSQAIAQAIAAIWGVMRQMEDLSVHLSMSLSSKCFQNTIQYNEITLVGGCLLCKVLVLINT